MFRQPALVHPVLLALALSCAAAFPARAADTILRLSDTATIMVPPDELAASLRAEAAAPTAAEAQKRVNDMMRDAVTSAKKVDGIAVSTGGYNVWRAGPASIDRTEHWQAGETINLTGKDAEAMLRLVGDLQQKGLAQGGLGWRLSAEAERIARKEAIKQALGGLRGRADEAADVLGLKFSSFKEVRLDTVTPPPVIQRQNMMSRSLASTSTPTVEAEDLPVTARAEADIVLQPR